VATFEIISDERFSSSLEYIRGRIGGEEVVERSGRWVLQIKCETDNPGAIADAVADIIITDCKAFYINERIRLPIKDAISRFAFTSALLAFDRDTDKIIVKTILKMSKSFNLDSFYDFKIDILKTRWDEVCLLANDNACYLACQKTFLELLRFLISNIDCEVDDTMFMHIKEFNIREDVKKLFNTCILVN
jgi:hypothetical protein